MQRCKLYLIIFTSILAACTGVLRDQPDRNNDSAGRSEGAPIQLPATWTPAASETPRVRPTSPPLAQYETRQVEPTPSATVSPLPVENSLSAEGPWYLACMPEYHAQFRDIWGDGRADFQAGCFAEIAPSGDQIFSTSLGNFTVFAFPSLDVIDRLRLQGRLLYMAMAGKFIHWSPDGRLLSYVVDHYEDAEQGPLELYLYRAETMTSEPTGITAEQIVPLGWSPDSSSLVFYTGTGRHLEGLFALDATTGQERLVSTTIAQGDEWNYGWLVGWLSGAELVFHESYRGETSEKSLEYLNLSTGAQRTIKGHPGLWWDAGVDPVSKILLYGVQDCESDSGVQCGLYMRDLRSRSEQYLGMPAADWWLEAQNGAITWHPSLQLFSVAVNPNGVAMYALDGDMPLVFEGASRAVPSPNGDFIAVVYRGEIGFGNVLLFRRDGSLLHEYPYTSSEGVDWFPASDGIFLDFSGGVYRSEEANGWEPELIPRINSIDAIVE